MLYLQICRGYFIEAACMVTWCICCHGYLSVSIVPVSLIYAQGGKYAPTTEAMYLCTIKHQIHKVLSDEISI